MTVAELILFLKEQPQNLTVIHRCCSDYNGLEETDIKLIEASDKKVVLRDGRYHDYNFWEWPDGMVPQFQTVVCFPGN